jgi:hypothetical protein
VRHAERKIFRRQPRTWEAKRVIKHHFYLRLAGWTMAAWFGLAFLAVGCGQHSGGSSDEARARMTKLGQLYGRYSAAHRGLGPTNEQEFKDFITKMPADQLPAGVDPKELDTLFTCPRDGKPYGVVYSVAGGAPGPEGAPIIVYEQVGSGGKHYVCRNNVKIDEVDEPTFKKLVPAPG